MNADSTQKELLVSLGESFYSERPYRRAGGRPGRIFLILLAVTAVLSIPGYVRLVSAIHTIKTEYVEPAIYRLPVMEVINGKVSSSVKQPFKLYSGDQLLFVLDTTGKITSLKDSGAWAYMGTDHFAMYEDGQRTSIKSFDFTGTKYLILDPMSLKNWVDRILPFLYPLLFLITTAGIYLFRVVQMLAYASAAFFVLMLLKRRVGYELLLILAGYAMVPSMTIETIAMNLPVALPLEGMIFYLVMAGYTFWGVRAYIQGQEDEIPGPDL